MVLVQVQQFGSETRYKIQILHQSVRRVKTKSQKVLGLIPTFVEVTGQKLVGEPFWLGPF